jgi:hypothetical protein
LPTGLSKEGDRGHPGRRYLGRRRPGDGNGSIHLESAPLHWWLLDRWLELGHPHWEWWDRAWGRVSPWWGDPFCAAFLFVWAPLYRTKVESSMIEIGWDALPATSKQEVLARRDDELEPPQEAHEPAGEA